MPEPHREIYSTATLCIVVLSTIVCGGMTEPFLKKLGLGDGNFAAAGIDDDIEAVNDSAATVNKESSEIPLVWYLSS